MFQPKKVKYRKQQKGRKRKSGLSKGGTKVSFGNFGIKALEYKWITSRQIEAARRAIVRNVQKTGKLWIRIFPHQAVTSKGGEMGMGHGKGGVDRYVFPVKPGRILFEIDGVSEEAAREAMKLAAHKLPIKTKFVKR